MYFTFKNDTLDAYSICLWEVLFTGNLKPDYLKTDNLKSYLLFLILTPLMNACTGFPYSTYRGLIFLSYYAVLTLLQRLVFVNIEYIQQKEG